jgi:hypothetical protein
MKEENPVQKISVMHSTIYDSQIILPSIQLSYESVLATTEKANKLQLTW